MKPKAATVSLQEIPTEIEFEEEEGLNTSSVGGISAMNYLLISVSSFGEELDIDSADQHDTSSDGSSCSTINLVDSFSSFGEELDIDSADQHDTSSDGGSCSTMNLVDSFSLSGEESESTLQNQVPTLESRQSDKESGGAIDRKEDIQRCCSGLEELTEELAADNEGMIKQLEATKAELSTTQQTVADLNQYTLQLQETLGAESTARAQVEQQLTSALQNIAGLENKVSSLRNELAASQQLVTALNQDKAASDTKITQLSNELSTVNSHLKNARAEISKLTSQLQAKQLYCDNFEKTERKLLQDNHRLNEIRRVLHDRVIQLSGNIRVYVRVRQMLMLDESEVTTSPETASSGSGSRPSSRNGPGRRPSSRDSVASRRSSISKLTARKTDVKTDLSPFHFPAITDDRSSKDDTSSYADLTKQTIELVEPWKDRGGLSNRQKKWKYGFDRVFQPNDTQENVWRGAEPLVQSCLDGFNVCMFGEY